MLDQLGLTKYLPIFEEQDVDLQVFLSLTDNDLKEIGIKYVSARQKTLETRVYLFKALALIAYQRVSQEFFCLMIHIKSSLLIFYCCKQVISFCRARKNGSIFVNATF